MFTHVEVLRWASKSNVAVHTNGFIVLSPPASGKTHFVQQHMTEWVDADVIFSELGIHTQDWHDKVHTEAEHAAHYKECDLALKVMEEVGLWVVGSLFWDYVPNAIVIIPEDMHRVYTDRRKDLNWKGVKKVRLFLEKMSRKHNVFVFPNFNELQTVAELYKSI